MPTLQSVGHVVHALPAWVCSSVDFRLGLTVQDLIDQHLGRAPVHQLHLAKRADHDVGRLHVEERTPIREPPQFANRSNPSMLQLPADLGLLDKPLNDLRFLPV